MSGGKKRPNSPHGIATLLVVIAVYFLYMLFIIRSALLLPVCLQIGKEAKPPCYANKL